ncbi:hypothetical protein [Paenibacillus ginsengarvi]|uniref:Uncharacterized protein n=1 Tax=Paenibacillus ginsengarvi TaxID=400777 RepID=A0A3B0BG72_9BACL|nr:hypothetical protein [Paenibacillus ginsengarvi]RKN72395.1 hypothetical protein D7M11_28365 [Paenibacillus ginsengarvi]
MIREWYVRIGTVLTFAFVLLTGFLGYYTLNPHAFAASPVQPSAATPVREALFEPASVRPGDSVAGMSAVAVSPGTHGVNSVSVLFAGDKQISGRFEVRDRVTEPYNPGDVIFTVDGKSEGSLPKAMSFHEVPNRFALTFANPDDKRRFGPAGSSGTGTIAISGYMAVYAPILEGTSDRATLAEIKTLHVIAPLSPEVNNPDFDKNMKPFPALKLKPAEAAAKPAAVYAWLEAVDKAFYGLEYNGKKISAAQRDKVKLWLQGAFTEERVDRLLEQHVPESEGGYLIGGGSSGLFPPLVIKDVVGPKLVAASDGLYAFTVTWIVSGTQDARMVCYLKYGANGWKIASYEYELI